MAASRRVLPLIRHKRGLTHIYVNIGSLSEALVLLSLSYASRGTVLKHHLSVSTPLIRGIHSTNMVLNYK